MAFVGIRGATSLKDSIELQAHLATLLRLENVGILLGAGASVAAGGKTMEDLWDDFVDSSPDEAQWMVDNGFVEPSAVAHPVDRTVPNVEKLGDALEIAHVEWLRQDNEQLPELERARAHLARAVVRAAQLQPSWWTSPGGLKPMRHNCSTIEQFCRS